MSMTTLDTVNDRMDIAPALALRVRLIATVVCIACLALLAVASGLTPNHNGHSTHKSLGLPPCTLLSLTGVPCPSCGMTTSFAHAAEGRLDHAFITQPGGALLALMTAMAVLVSGYIAVTGRNIAVYFRPLLSTRAVTVFLAFLLAAWVYKIVITLG